MLQSSRTFFPVIVRSVNTYSTPLKILSSVVLLTLPSYCDSKNTKEPQNDSKKEGLDKILKNFESDIPLQKIKYLFESGLMGQVGYGFMMGYSSGFCIKKISKVAAFVLGGFFIAVQTLSYNGYINIDYNQLQKDAEKYLDLNNDGKIDQKDAEIALKKAQDILQYNLPGGGGFASGLVLGLRG